MKKEIPKAYEPDKYEDDIYTSWEKSGYFNPDNLDLPENAHTYTIVLPPPNITDKLHLGHSSMLAIEDLMIRYHRMKGDRTLWIPGTDHAAIATQNVVEKKLLKEEGSSRHNLGRVKFLEKVWEFLNVTQSTILHQTRKMGASLDWSRQAFTLDEQREKAVRKMFVDMYNAGIIYRGERIVNWCPRCKSTLADDEVEYKEQKTMLYTFKYSKDFPVTIATTRPETKLGDTAVAVNPKDERYKDYIGKTYEVDFVGVSLQLKIIADWQVDQNFGTGALGVTPAHAMVDWQMAGANNLPIIKVIDEDGNIHKGFGEYSGKKAVEAREMILGKLREKGLLEKEEEITNNLSLCYRCETPIEPLPSKQWFVAIDKGLEHLGGRSLKAKAIEVAEKGEIKFIPDRFKKRYLDWMNSLHDWCISRQIWFGHRIPVWYRGEEVFVGEEEPEGKGWEQDPDTLDTWFSSGMWTFSTLGWPDNYKDKKKIGDLAKFHPTQILETGYEIITLWVSRMIIMSLFALSEIPFENVYLHGMVLDKNGKKMSKSKGNGIDPIDVIDRFGTDSVRLSLLIGNTPGNDLRLSEEKIAGFRNLVNKIWNVARYIITNYELTITNYEFDGGELTLSEQWILLKLNQLTKEVSEDIANYRFSPAGEKLREFTWDCLADWFLETTKFEDSKEKEKVLSHILTTILKLWHPFIPFITEKIWQDIDSGKFLMVEKWPEELKIEKPNNDFEIIKDIIIAIRNARAENKVEPAKKIKAIIYAGSKKELIESQTTLIKSLRTGIENLEIKEGGGKIDNAIYATTNGMEIYLIGAIDTAKEKERLQKEIANLEKMVKNIETKLANEEFIVRAPEEIVNQEKERLEKYKEELEKLKDRFEKL
ncbi:MAG: Valine--tRNA ligase [Parcubacteria group bacterium ADurb.Bin316]|nr:MAG: Valine--tRNA ligase [Parcubacteria group bacterium ADurb.Bin316]HOZ55983.1 valine--tRNA ligase [bacterium]